MTEINMMKPSLEKLKNTQEVIQALYSVTTAQYNNMMKLPKENRNERLLKRMDQHADFFEVLLGQISSDIEKLTRRDFQFPYTQFPYYDLEAKEASDHPSRNVEIPKEYTSEEFEKMKEESNKTLQKMWENYENLRENAKEEPKEEPKQQKVFDKIFPVLHESRFDQSLNTEIQVDTSYNEDFLMQTTKIGDSIVRDMVKLKDASVEKALRDLGYRKLDFTAIDRILSEQPVNQYHTGGEAMDKLNRIIRELDKWR